MTKHLQRDMDSLRKNILVLGSLVEESINKSIKALADLNVELIDEIMSSEKRINEMEVDVEEECLKILALHQPVAIDLRFLIVVLKVNNDLERMGDQAVNIAGRVRHLSGQPRLDPPLDFIAMGKLASNMVHTSLDALVNQDTRTAQKVLDMDDELDNMHAEAYRVLQKLMAENPVRVSESVSHLTISSNLERIGDLSTNIAEEVMFMEEGEVVRHRQEDLAR